MNRLRHSVDLLISSKGLYVISKTQLLKDLPQSWSSIYGEGGFPPQYFKTSSTKGFVASTPPDEGGLHR
jgi:hypothetical protein